MSPSFTNLIRRDPDIITIDDVGVKKQKRYILRELMDKQSVADTRNDYPEEALVDAKDTISAIRSNGLFYSIMGEGQQKEGVLGRTPS